MCTYVVCRYQAYLVLCCVWYRGSVVWKGSKGLVWSSALCALTPLWLSVAWNLFASAPSNSVSVSQFRPSHHFSFSFLVSVRPQDLSFKYLCIKLSFSSAHITPHIVIQTTLTKPSWIYQNELTSTYTYVLRVYSSLYLTYYFSNVMRKWRQNTRNYLDFRNCSRQISFNKDLQLGAKTVPTSEQSTYCSVAKFGH